MVVPYLLALLFAQAPQTTPTFLETLDVRITNVDVVVTDRAGKAVRNLRREDFTILENGVPQAITNFAEYGGSSGVAETATAPAPAAAPSAERAIDTGPQRKFLFFVDEMSLTGSAGKQLIDSAAALLRGEMRPGDEAMVVTRGKGTAVDLDFTADRALVETRLREAIERQTSFRTNTAYQQEQLFFNTIHASSSREYLQMARVYAARVNRRVTSTLRSLLGLVGSLNQTSGRKILVVMSESLSAQPGREAFQLQAIDSSFVPTMQVLVPDFPGEAMESAKFDAADGSAHASWFDVRPMIRELAARASANGVTIYSLQPDFAGGIKTPGAGADASGRMTVNRRGQDARGGTFALGQFQRVVVDETRETLQTLADDTGGKYFVGAREIPGGFRQIAEDLSSYYSLGYRSDGGGEQNVRKIDVRVKGHPDFVVRARREMLRRSPEREMDEMVAANLIAPRAVNELGITATAGKTEHRLDGRYRVPVVVKIPLAKVTFIPDGDKYRGAFTIHFAAADGADYTTGIYREQTVEIPAAAIDAARQEEFTYTSFLVVAPGTLQVSVGVYDKYSRLTGFQQMKVKL